MMTLAVYHPRALTLRNWLAILGSALASNVFGALFYVMGLNLTRCERLIPVA
jgi:hypothetical protein